MNILLANISTFSKKDTYTYKVEVPDCSVDTIDAMHTNDSILQCVNNLNSVKSSGGLNKVIALVSNASHGEINNDFQSTAYDYYCTKVKEYSPDCDIQPIRIQDEEGTQRATSEILFEICNNIENDDVVYIDSAGGMRTINNVIQVLTNILKYKGIRNPCTLYADIQDRKNKRSKIVDTSEFTRITNLAEAFNEFMTTGKADQLQCCLAFAYTNEPIKKLLHAMVEFSDRIRIGDVDNLDTVIKTLRKSIYNCNKTSALSAMGIEGVILQQFLPLIEDRLIGRQKEKVNYVKVIDWCLDNVLIQQALTLFVEKVPKYLFDNDIIQYVGSKDERTEKIPFQTSWECYLLYSDLLSPQVKENTKVTELRTSLENWKLCSNDNQVKEAFNAVFSYKGHFPNHQGRNDKTDYLDGYIAKHKGAFGYNPFRSFVKGLCNEPTSLAALMGIEAKSGNDTIEKKFRSISQIKASGALKSDYRCSCTVNQLVDILYGYVYVKALRNQINHASSTELLNDDGKKELECNGYSFSDNSLDTIKANILFALQSVKNVIGQPKVIEKTELKVGNVIKAIIKDKENRIVIVDGYSYDIQLVVPRDRQYTEKNGDVVNVRINQISKDLQIMQVKLI